MKNEKEGECCGTGTNACDYKCDECRWTLLVVIPIWVDEIFNIFISINKNTQCPEDSTENRERKCSICRILQEAKKNIDIFFSLLI